MKKDSLPILGLQRLASLSHSKTRMNWQKFERFSPKKLTSESFDNDNKLTLKIFFAVFNVFFFTRTNEGKMETTSRKTQCAHTVPDFPKYSSVTLKS